MQLFSRDKKRLLELEEASCPSAGSCQGLYTANTMACLTEIMGMSLSGCATAAAVSARKKRIAFESGMAIVKMVEENITPSKIITKDDLLFIFNIKYLFLINNN